MSSERGFFLFYHDLNDCFRIRLGTSLQPVERGDLSLSFNLDLGGRNLALGKSHTRVSCVFRVF